MSSLPLAKTKKEDDTMTKEEKIVELERMLRGCPEIMTPNTARKYSPFGINTIYKMIRDKEIRAFVYRNGYFISKHDLIEYIAEHSDDPTSRKCMKEIKK